MPAPPPLTRVPFEDTSRPFFERLFATIKLAFTEPGRLFDAVEDGPLGPPVIFAVVVGGVAQAIGALWGLLTNLGLGALTDAKPAEVAFNVGVSTVMFVGAPIFVLLGLFVSSGIYHVMLLVLGGANRSYNVTLRVVAYAMSPSVLAIIPVCGGAVGGIWSVVLTILGAIRAHRTDAWRAIVAYFLPAVVCCCVIGGLIFLIATAIAGAAGSQGLTGY